MRKPRDTGAVLKQWDAIKRAEKNSEHAGYFAGLTRALPALMLAQKAQTKAARVGFDWSEIKDVVAKVDEELNEAKEAISSTDEAAIADEMGDLLFAVVNLARKNKLDAETVLAAATEKFIARFHAMEEELKATGQKLGEVDLAAMDEIWNRVKNECSLGWTTLGSAHRSAPRRTDECSKTLSFISPLTTVFAAGARTRRAASFASQSSAVADDN